MQDTQKTEEALRQAESAIRALVGKLIKASSVRPAEEDDIAQILRLHVARKAAAHDPGRSSLKTYIENIVANRLRDFMKAQRAACRDRRLEEISMDEDVLGPDGGPEPFGETIDGSDALRRAGMLPWAAEDALIMDVKLVLEDLTEADRLTCDVLAVTKSLREAAERLGIHVETLRQRVERIRAEFASRGITGT